MKRLTVLMGLCSLLAAASVCAETLTPRELADAMLKARYSSGFEARMQIASSASATKIPVKLAVVGQIDAQRQRLMLRGISPAKLRGSFIAVEEQAGHEMVAIRYQGEKPDAMEAFDISSSAFDSGLVVWDMLAPWWRWPNQQFAGADQVGGKPCTLLRSTAAKGGHVSEVISCIDVKEHLALSVALYDQQHQLLRTLVVDKPMRKHDGQLAAKVLSIQLPHDETVQVNAYSGDEDYTISEAQFAPLDKYIGQRSEDE